MSCQSGPGHEREKTCSTARPYRWELTRPGRLKVNTTLNHLPLRGSDLTSRQCKGEKINSNQSIIQTFLWRCTPFEEGRFYLSDLAIIYDKKRVESERIFV